MILKPEQRCFKNIAAWARHVGLDLPLPVKEEADRCWYKGGFNLDSSINRMVRAGELVPANYKNHGETAIDGWRESRGRCTAQIVAHKNGIYEIDFDLWNPWDLVGLIGHGLEVATNKLGRRKTDPFKVVEMLRERGINA